MGLIDFGLLNLLLIVLFFAILQSIVGVGLLLFGTPTLLLIGYPYEIVLSLLLPSSIAISTMQVAEGHRFIYGKKNLFFYTLPSIGFALYYVTGTKSDVNIAVIVGMILVITGFVRISSRLNYLLEVIIRNNERLYCMIMGVVHGLSNMGGGLLTIYMSTLSNDKAVVRYSIAYWYLIFALIQILILYLSGLLLLSTDILLLMMVSFSSYFLVGRLLARKINYSNYQLLVTIFIFIYGISCIVFTG